MSAWRRPAPAVGWETDAQLRCEPATSPGAGLPHAWRNYSDPSKPKVSAHDLCGSGHFMVLTVINSRA